jgi:peptidoglycan/xylan/chitin deacetylase (PgdA/CDA1 family)
VFPADTTILAYHQVTGADSPKDPAGLAMSAGQFAFQMRYLFSHGYRCLSLMEILRPLENKSLQRKRTFVLTFDDGYEDFLTQAYPILRRHGFTATVFLVTDRVGECSDWQGEAGTPLLSWEQVKALHRDGVSFGSHTCNCWPTPTGSRAVKFREWQCRLATGLPAEWIPEGVDVSTCGDARATGMTVY